MIVLMKISSLVMMVEMVVVVRSGSEAMVVVAGVERKAVLAVMEEGDYGV